MWKYLVTTIALIGVKVGRIQCDQPIIDERRNQRMKIRSLQVGIPYKIELLLSLDYLNDTVAVQFETSETIPSTNASIHFCYAVNTQSSGNQVAFSAAEIGATVQTRYVDAGSIGTSSQCTILGTSRNYDVDYNITAAKLFSLELAIGQIVYVQSNFTTLSLDEVTGIVETGFSRGVGGRVRFRSLLVTNPYFRSIVNIEVLSNLSSPVGIPIAIGTPSPTVTPEDIPSMSPSSIPIIEPSELPSTLLSPVPTMTIYPSASPTSVPNVTSPTTVPNSNPPAGERNRTSSPSLLPLSAQSPSASAPLTDPTLSPSSRPTPSSPAPSMLPMSPASTQVENELAIIVGGIVGGIGFVLATLFLVFCICYPICIGRKGHEDRDSENASGSFPGHQLTMTPLTQAVPVPCVLTLDEDSQSLANTTLDGKSSAPIFTHGRPDGSPYRIQLNESFDESSVYTSTTDPSTLIGNDTLQSSPQSINDIYTGGNGDHTGSVADSKDSDIVTIHTSSPMDLKLVPTQALANITSEANKFDPFDDGNENFADDESSLEFGSSMALSDPSFASPSENPAASLKSDETNRIENLNPDTTQQLPSSSADPSDDSDAFQDGYISKNHHSGTTLLEHFLISSQTKPTFSTSKSVSSLRSAPSRLVIQRPFHETKTVPSLHGRPPQHGNRLLSINNNTAIQTNRLSASSVGPSFRSRFLHNPSKVFNGSKHGYPLTSGSVGERRSQNSSVFRNQPILKQVPISPGFEDLNEYVGLQMPSTDSTPQIDVLHHALTRQTMSVVTNRDEIDSVTKHSSRYGNYSSASSMYDSSSGSGRSGSWLFDTDEHTFDSDPRIGGLQSTISRSRTSGRRDTKSDHDRINVAKNEIVHQNGMHTTNGVANRSTMDEQKSTDHAAGSYSWQSALGTYGPSSISSSSTTGSGSRSTLSSRVDAQYKEQYEVLAPPGKINIVLVTDFHNGSGTVISKVRSTSALQGKLCEGDELVAIDGDDVTNMVIAEITAIMTSRAGRERKLTVLRDPSSPNARHTYAYQEAKQDGNT